MSVMPHCRRQYNFGKQVDPNWQKFNFGQRIGRSWYKPILTSELVAIVKNTQGRPNICYGVGYSHRQC